MRTWIFFLSSLLIPILTSAEVYSHEEIWVNEKYQLKVKLKFSNNKIKAKNLSHRGWSTYKKVRPGVFRSKRGNKLVLEDRNVLVYSSPYRSRNIVFRPRGYAPSCAADAYGYRYGDEFYRSGKRRDYDDYDRRHGIADRNYGTKPNYSRRNIGGTWYVEDSNRKLYISEFNGGFEVRLEGQTQWTKYHLKDHDFYLDKDGNSYTIKNDKALFWESRDGRRSHKIRR